VAAINKSLVSLTKNLQNTTKESPRLQEYLQELTKEREKLQIEISQTEQGITALYNSQDKAKRLRDLNIKRGKVIGRISLFLESIDFTDNKDENRKIDNLKNELKDLSTLVDRETKEEKLVSILSKINLQMSKWVDRLDVEYTDASIRFDLSKLTIFADTATKPIPLNLMGSGANWVSYHLLIHFALHQHFIQLDRPVPRFLILDQPSQVYYPPDKDAELQGALQENADEKAVRMMFDFIIDITRLLSPKFQVIVTDHAYLKTDNFKSSVIEVWRNGLKLIPETWYK
jgi:hypothetical protein